MKLSNVQTWYGFFQYCGAGASSVNVSHIRNYCLITILRPATTSEFLFEYKFEYFQWLENAD